jgi:hypothetical protein
MTQHGVCLRLSVFCISEHNRAWWVASVDPILL